jgi:hypothetical protein
MLTSILFFLGCWTPSPAHPLRTFFEIYFYTASQISVVKTGCSNLLSDHCIVSTSGPTFPPINLFIHSLYIVISAPSPPAPITQLLPPPPILPIPSPVRRDLFPPSYEPILAHQVTAGLGTSSPTEVSQCSSVRGMGSTGRQEIRGQPLFLSSGRPK